MTSDDSPPRWPRGLTLVLACAFSFVLASEHLSAGNLPGCGPESACAQAFASVWGSLPWIGWPTAFLGASYFLALTVAWFAGRGQLGQLRWVVRLGATASVILLLAMVARTGLCPYCLGAHLAHLTFFVLQERDESDGPTPWLPFAALFLLSSAGLLWASSSLETRRADDQEARLQDTLEELRAPAPLEGFTGRYREGPAEARARLVLISDYQCPDCQRIDKEVRGLLERYRDDLSVSAKHFPFCTDCNERVPSNLHPNACRAARAAEAAGLLGGDEAFWTLHRWLFDRGANFSTSELQRAAAAAGLDPQAFLRTLEGPETLGLVQADIREALGLGLHFTPMVFLNGTEVRGWNAPRAIERAVEAVLASAAPAADADGDRPDSAAAKYVADWEAQPRVSLPPPGRGEILDPAKITVVVWGDYFEPNTRTLDARLRTAIEGDDRYEYSFRHFPVERDCNPHAPRTMHPGACFAARLADAAFGNAGSGGFAAMHARLMQEGPGLDRERAKVLAAECSLVPDSLLMSSDVRAKETVRADIENAQQLGLRSLPFFFVDGKPVPRWKLAGATVPEDILRRAAELR